MAVTNGPGLSGSLLIGVNVAKSLGFAWNKKVFGVNHLEGHIYSAWLENLFKDSNLDFPLACLIASGGHTDLIIMNGHLDYEVIARTRDDAAGEAFDKVARVLGLGFPGGPEIKNFYCSTSRMLNNILIFNASSVSFHERTKRPISRSFQRF